LHRLELSWQAAASPAQLHGRAGTGNLTLETLADFSILKRAIAAVSASDEESRDALSARPLRRTAVMQALAEELGMPEVAGCCLQVSKLPPLQVDAADFGDTSPGVAAAPESVFYRRCSLCHRTNERFPPNFLMGEPAEVREKLAHCAERLFLRLSMWELPEAQRSKTPMPPLQAFQQLGIEASEWQGHPELAALQEYARQQLLSQTGKTPQLEKLVARGYENLRPCLAQAGQ
jgi:mono/diheme cytochrome c family protein